MIYKKRSSRWLLTKYVLVLPVLVCTIAISASRAPISSLTHPDSAAGESIRVRGNITNESKEPVADATVIIAGTTRGTTTDRNGWFELDNVPANAKLVITHVAYQTFELTVASSQAELLLVMKKAVNQIAGPVVVGKPVIAETIAPSSSPRVAESNDMKVVEQRPEFPGGREALMQYLMQSLQYPETARQIKVEAIALVSFTVDKNGDIRNARSLKNIGYGIDKEALRVVNEMPKWNPAVQNGKPVEMEYTLEVNFKIDKNEQDKRQGFMNFRANNLFPVPDKEEISAFFNGSLNLSKWGKSTDIAIREPWTAISRTVPKAYIDEKTGKSKYVKYGGYFMLPTPVVGQ